LKINRNLIIFFGIFTALISVPSFFWITGNLGNAKSAAYKRAKKLMNPDLYLTYRITERILEANNIKRPIRIAVRKGVDCSNALGLDPSSNKCIAAQLLPDIDKTSNFDIWASQVINTMSGQANALASSDSGVLVVNKPLLKELMGRPEQLACVISHELAHITQNHNDEKRKARLKYDSVAAARISQRIEKLKSSQAGAYFMAAVLGGISDSYSGTNNSLNQLSNQMAFNNLASQILAPQITEKAMEYSPVIAESINKLQGLSPEYMKQGFSYIDNYLRDAALSLTAFGRGLEYEADLLGTKYAATAGFNEKSCLKLWTETMPHDTDKIVARLLPQGVSDPGKKKPEIFINKEKESVLDKKYKGHPKCSSGEWGERHPKCKEISKTKNRKDDNKISEATLEILRTHPSDERRAEAIREYIKNKELFNKFRITGKKNKLSTKMRDWSYDKDSDSLVISDIEKDPKLIGLEDTGTTGINIDKFLD
tara:strand:- start:998 stop:2446 length:1449 start_codon:yes stop_codon:yes gene_type:complete